MQRIAATVCPFCEARALAKAFSPSWQQQSRNAATMQKRRPSRMVLSEKVAKGPSRTAPDGSGKQVKMRTKNSPFGGMNTTAVPRMLQVQRNKISAAEKKRQENMRPGANKREETPKDPMRAMKMQRRLANVSYEKRNRVKQEIAERESFDDFDLLPIIKDSISTQALAGQLDIAPSPVQRLAIPALLGTPDGRRRKRKVVQDEPSKDMKQFLLAAETGSGKTLAYALPMVDAIKRAEKREAEQKEREERAKEDAKKIQGRMFELEAPEVEDHSKGRPRGIILVPTAELVNQVGGLMKSLSHTVKFRTAIISASFTGTVIRNRLFGPNGVDIVIATPHLLNSICESDPNILSRVSHMVIDEADSLLDRSFSPITSGIIDRAAPSLEKLVFCSATIPRSVDSYLNKRYPETKRLVTPNLHAIPRRVQLSVVDIEKVPYQGNRDLACAQTIWDIGKEAAEAGEERQKKIVVFVNEREKTVELADYLKSKGIDASALSRDSDDRKQAEILASFTGTNIGVPRSSEKKTSRNDSTQAITPLDLAETSTTGSAPRQLSNTKVLVMTDIGSRGIDTLLVKHVILYDVPHTSIDFIHRLGRVGRMGRRGRGIVLTGKHDRKDIVKEVREGMFRGQALI
ncbi:Putative helicase, P-loop containing nucleoside triphosphate hydrolase [Septoria linicola]|uniref:RNA helicase n=1 Tax=Septoria linicola TaxID=215465 RepID=A0A9Q9APR4_9PEZI|nr:Putative helicase, P-loop containing nucleoside triphosphate hydrolase [Septoria linicola]